MSPGPGHSSIALSLGSGEEFLLGDLFEHFESVRDKDGGYLLPGPGAHWLRSDTLLSQFKKTKLKHGAVCLTSLVFRHLRSGQSPGVECGPPELSVQCLTRLWSGT